MEILGTCPHCFESVLYGKYGAFCTNKCGMSLNYAYGRKLEKKQIIDILEKKAIYIKMKNRNGNERSAFLRPERVESYSYVSKNGETKKGYRYNYRIEYIEN